MLKELNVLNKQIIEEKKNSFDKIDFFPKKKKKQKIYLFIIQLFKFVNVLPRLEVTDKSER